MKICQRCKKEFEPVKRHPHQRFCSDLNCKKEYHKNYYELNKEKLLKQSKEYFKLNKEQYSKLTKEWYRKNKKSRAIQIKNYQQLNKDKISQQRKDYYLRNKEKIKEHQENHKEEKAKYNKEYCLMNKDKISKRKREYLKNKREINLNYRIIESLRSRTSKILRYNYRYSHSLELVDCSAEYLKQYLEKQFKLGMSWNNYGRGWNGNKEWHIDHIRPITSFDLTKESEQKICFHYTNLQPLWARDNLLKGDKV